MTHYDAPWSTGLKVTSVLSALICAGIGLLPYFLGAPGGANRAVLALPLVVIAFAALFSIRGYTVTTHEILVRRLFWNTRLPRPGLRAAKADPDAMRYSARLLGNGGFFAITGLFRNKVLGTYRAFVTDRNRAVVLRYEKRVIVVSPGDPDAFLRELGVPREI